MRYRWWSKEGEATRGGGPSWMIVEGTSWQSLTSERRATHANLKRVPPFLAIFVRRGATAPVENIRPKQSFVRRGATVTNFAEENAC